MATSQQIGDSKGDSGYGSPKPPEQTVLAPETKAAELRVFGEKDVFWEDDTRKYKAIIVKALNRIHREDERCKNLDPGSVFLAPDRSKPGKPVFFVQCSPGHDVVNVYFSPADVGSTKPFSAPGHIDHTKAVDLCEGYAKQHAAHPLTVDFSRTLSLAVTDQANGRTTVQSKFLATNSSNTELQYRIRCLLDSSGLIEARVADASD
jgi:hypothetical protein